MTILCGLPWRPFRLGIGERLWTNYSKVSILRRICKAPSNSQNFCPVTANMLVLLQRIKEAHVLRSWNVGKVLTCKIVREPASTLR